MKLNLCFFVLCLLALQPFPGYGQDLEPIDNRFFRMDFYAGWTNTLTRLLDKTGISEDGQMEHYVVPCRVLRADSLDTCSVRREDRGGPVHSLADAQSEGGNLRAGRLYPFQMA